MTAALVADRSCGGCTLCCVLPDIDALSKPANSPCRHCLPGRGCAAYEARPALCRDFHCLWMTDGRLGEEWEPSAARMMAYRQGPQLTVLVDPAFPAAWRGEPYRAQLGRWAAEAEESGGYVIVFVGDEAFKVAPAAG